MKYNAIVLFIYFVFKFAGISYFLRLCGPAIGYTLASKVLNVYIEPSLTPTITTADPRWLGAWWIGWLALGVPILISSGIFGAYYRNPIIYVNLNLLTGFP